MFPVDSRLNQPIQWCQDAIQTSMAAGLMGSDDVMGKAQQRVKVGEASDWAIWGSKLLLDWDIMKIYEDMMLREKDGNPMFKPQETIYIDLFIWSVFHI